LLVEHLLVSLKTVSAEASAHWARQGTHLCLSVEVARKAKERKVEEGEMTQPLPIEIMQESLQM